MTEKELMLFAYQQSTTPVIKNPILQKAMDQGPRIKVAEQDNMNTPDLEQSPDSFLRPGETLEDFDVKFRRPNAQGGMQQLVSNTVDGSRPGYKGERVYNSPDVDTFSDALLDAYAKDDITKIVESGKSTKFANVITAIESGKDKSAKLAKVIKNTGLDEETIFNLLDDRKAYIDLAREGGPSGANPRAGNFYRKAENWITTNSKRYADPDKFKKAFIRTFGTNNDLIKTMKKLNVPGARKQTSVPFSSWFKETILGSTKGSDAGYNFNQLNNIFKTSIYTNNETVRNKLTKEINRILSIPLEKGGKFDIRNEIKSSPLFKKFGFDKQIRGPIARLLANEIGQELLDQVSSFRDPYLGTTELIRFLKNNVDPKYKSMFEEAAKAADLAAKNKWPEAKQILKIKDNIMFDHKIPKELVKLGYADELEYIKLNPTSAEFNTRIKNPEFDQKIVKLAKDFERTTSLDGKAKVVEKMNILKNKFSEKYGGYLDEVSIVPDKTGKPIFKSSAAPVTKQTDFVSSLGKSMVQAGEITTKEQIKLFKKMGFRCNKAGGGAEDVACYLDDVKKTKADARSSDVIKRAKALTKERKALSVAKTLPKVGNIIRKGVQVGAGAVSSALSAVGFGPVGVAIEAAIEGGFYDNARRNGYTHEQAYAETFLPKLITDAAGTTNTNTKLFEGADAMIEKEKLGKEDSLASKFNNAQNIYFKEATKLDNMVNSYLAMEGTGVSKKNLDAFLEKIDQQEAKVRNLTKAIKPGTPEYEAYKIAEENQAGRIENRKNDYLSMNRIPYVDENFEIQEKTFPLSPEQIKLQEKKLQSKIRSGDKRRDKEMQEYKTDLEGNILPPTSSYDFSKFKSYDDKLIKFEKLREIGGLDLTDKIGLAGGVANMAQGGIMSLKKK